MGLVSEGLSVVWAFVVLMLFGCNALRRDLLFWLLIGVSRSQLDFDKTAYNIDDFDISDREAIAAWLDEAGIDQLPGWADAFWRYLD